MRHSRATRAFTTIEVLLASSIFILVSGVIFFALGQSTQIFAQVDGNFDALTQLRRASSWVPKDLQRTDPATFDTKRVTTGGGGHGNAIWMLTAVDEFGEFQRDDDGVPIYQRNILYYLVRPNNHATISDGVNCDINDGAYPNGDPFCPHKILIRKVIDIETDPMISEPLLTYVGVDTYLTLPDGYDLPGMVAAVGAPGVVDGSIRVVGSNLLSFDIDQSAPPFLRLLFRAVRINESRKEIPGFGSVDLTREPQTLEISTSVLPRG